MTHEMCKTSRVQLALGINCSAAHLQIEKPMRKGKQIDTQTSTLLFYVNENRTRLRKMKPFEIQKKEYS